MNLVLDKKYDEKFIYIQVPKIILTLYKRSCNKVKLSQVCWDLGIDTTIIDLAVRDFKITQTAESYIIGISKEYEYYINMITYGTRSVQGYPVLLDIFNFTKENIDQFYERWLDGH